MAFAIDVMVCYFLINFEKYVSSLLINELKCDILFNGYFVTHTTMHSIENIDNGVIHLLRSVYEKKGDFIICIQ